jgi:hypothetical protein
VQPALAARLPLEMLDGKGARGLTSVLSKKQYTSRFFIGRHTPRFFLADTRLDSFWQTHASGPLCAHRSAPFRTTSDSSLKKLHVRRFDARVYFLKKFKLTFIFLS